MNALQRISGGAAAAVAALLIAAPAYADGMRGSVKDAPEQRRCSFTANVALTSDYIFRGYSQSGGGAAIQGGFDATCGIFYAGVWGSSIDFGGDASLELDSYAGVKLVTGKITWDLGVIYYSYPNHVSGIADPNYVELKVGASGEIWKGGTLGATVFYSPDYSFETGEVWTVEGSFSQALPAMGRFSPTFSALIGYQKGEDATWKGAFANGANSYTYWNAGVTFAFDKSWSLDFRYWDTNVSDAGGFCTGDIFQCDTRYVATLKFALP